MSKRLPLERVSEQVGKNLISVLIQELNEVKHPTIENHSVWSAMPENMQGAALDRMQRKIRSALEQGYMAIFSIDTPAVPAELMKVVFQAGKVQATIEIPTSSDHRHELSDFTGRHVIVVMPNDLDEYFEGMDDIVAEADQAELDLDEPAENFDNDVSMMEFANRRRREECATHCDQACLECKGVGMVDYICEDESVSRVMCECVEFPPAEDVDEQDGITEYESVKTEEEVPATWRAGMPECKSCSGKGYVHRLNENDYVPCCMCHPSAPVKETNVVFTDLTDEERRAANLPDPDCVECGGTGEVMRDIEGDSEQPVLCPICMEGP